MKTPKNVHNHVWLYYKATDQVTKHIRVKDWDPVEDQIGNEVSDQIQGRIWGRVYNQVWKDLI